MVVAIALVGGGLLAHLLLDDPGYVATTRGDRCFETTVPVSLLVLRWSAMLLRSSRSALTSRRRLAQLRAERRRRRAREDTQRGLLDLAARQLERAEELLTRRPRERTSAAANYVVAARAADLQDAVAAARRWLARAQEARPQERAPALMTLAEMQMRRGQDEAALRTLEQLDASGDLNSRGLELMARLCQKLGRGEQLQCLGPRLRNAKELPEQQVNELLAQAQLEEIARSASAGTPLRSDRLDGRCRAARAGLPQALVAMRARALMPAATCRRRRRPSRSDRGDAASRRDSTVR